MIPSIPIVMFYEEQLINAHIHVARQIDGTLSVLLLATAQALVHYRYLAAYLGIILSGLLLEGHVISVDGAVTPNKINKPPCRLITHNGCGSSLAHGRARLIAPLAANQRRFGLLYPY